MPKKYYGIIMIAILILLGTSLYLQEKPLNKSVLRLHVIANSDSLADQALKIQVKDAVVEMMKKEFAGMDNMEQARQAALEDIPEIKRTAEAVVQANGYNYPVQVSLGEYQFPTNHMATWFCPVENTRCESPLAVVKENWWCVLFLPSVWFLPLNRA